MKKQVTTLMQWVEPDNRTWHNPGDVVDVDPSKIDNYYDLIAQGVFVENPTQGISAPAKSVTTNESEGQ